MRPTNAPLRIRWCSGIATGKSSALRDALVSLIQAGDRPVALVPCSSDIALRSERVGTLRHDAAQALGVDDLEGRLVRDLSSGERQRVLLAEALRPGMRVIALDEPSRHLDPKHIEALAGLLDSRRSEGVNILACDVRQTLPASLFAEQRGAPSLLQAHLSDSAPAPRDPAIAVSIPAPFVPTTLRRVGAVPIDLSMQVGSLTALGGRNGSGKSSLLKAIRSAAEKKALGVGLSRQDVEVQIFASTPRLEIAEVLAAQTSVGTWLEAAVGRTATEKAFIDSLSLEVGVAPWLDTPMGSIPLGGLALLGVAVALILGRDIVLLDEPTQGLDLLRTRGLAQCLIRCASAGSRMIIATHDPEIVGVANQQWHVMDGVLHQHAEA